MAAAGSIGHFGVMRPEKWIRAGGLLAGQASSLIELTRRAALQEALISERREAAEALLAEISERHRVTDELLRVLVQTEQMLASISSILAIRAIRICSL